MISSAFAKFGFTSKASTLASGANSEISSTRLPNSSTVIRHMPVRLPPGRLKLATRPARTGSLPARKTIGIAEVAFFAASAGKLPPWVTMTLTLRPTRSAANSGTDQPDLPPSVFDRHVLSLDVAGFAQSLAESGHIPCIRSDRRAAEPADHRHRLLLRAEVARHGHRAAQEQYQVAPLHSITSSARARIARGIVSPSALAVLRLMTSSNWVGCWIGISAGLAPASTRPA